MLHGFRRTSKTPATAPEPRVARAGTRARGLSAVLVATIAVVAIGVVEMVDGVATVADTAGTLSAMLLLFSIVAVAVRVISGRSTRSWPRRAMAGLAAASALLLVVMLVVTVRTHTASGRFEDQLAGFPLPTAYESIPVPNNTAAHSFQPEHAVRAWRVPRGADACADLEVAFRAWAPGNVESFSRGAACAAVDNDGTEKSEASLSQDGSTIVVEMWLEGSSLIHF